MPVFPIRVKVDASGAAVGTAAVRGQLTSLEGTAEKVTASIKRAFVGLGVALAARRVFALADAFTTIENRIKTVTDSQQQLNATTQEMFEIANRTRVSVQSVTEAYTRFSRATEALGTTQQQVLDLTESVNQAIILSGATGAEASAGLIQFAQGLAAGALRGDELRSVLEQLPEVARVIAQELNVPIGQLRVLGEQGKLTADVIVRAFANAKGALAEAFEETVPTLGQSLAVLRNNFIAFLGSIQSSTQIFSSLAELILGLAGVFTTFADTLGVLRDAINFLLTPFKAMGRELGVFFERIGVIAALILVPLIPAVIALAAHLGILTGVWAALNLVILANPLVLVGAAIVAVVGFVGLLTGALEEGRQAWVEYWSVGIGNIAGILGFEGALESATVAQTIWFRNILKSGEAMVANRLAAQRAAEFVGIYGDSLRRTGKEVANLAAIQVANATVAFGGLALAMQIAEKETKKTGAATMSLADQFKALEERIDPAAAAMNEYDEALDLVTKLTGTEFIPTQERANEIMTEFAKTLGLAGGELKTLEDLMRDAFAGEDFEVDLTIPGEELVTAFDEVIDRQERTIALQKLSAGERTIEVELAREIAALDQIGVILEEEMVARLRDNIVARHDIVAAQKVAEQQAKRAAKLEKARQQQIIDFVVDTSSSIIDAAFEADTKWSEFFRNMLEGFQKAILKALILQAITKAVTGEFNTGAGGIGNLLLTGFAHGGSFDVGGAGGTDSQVVAFRATPGEHVTIQTPQQQAAAPIVNTAPAQVFIVDNAEQAALAAMRSPAGGQIQTEHLMRNRRNLGRLF